MQSLMNIEETKLCSNKFQLYQRREKESLEKIFESFDRLNLLYETKNHLKFDRLKTEFKNSLNVVVNNHQKDADVIKKNIEKYIEISRNVSNKFKDII